MKKLLLFILSITTQFVSSTAQDVITFTWEGSAYRKDFCIDATPNTLVTIDWGDGNKVTHNTTDWGYIRIGQSIAYGNNNEYTVTITGGEGLFFLRFF